MLGKDMEEFIQEFKRKKLEADEAEKVIRNNLTDLINDYSKISNDIDEITKNNIDPLKDQLSMLEKAIIEIVNAAGFEKFTDGDFHGAYKNDDLSFVVKDWDSFYEYVKGYKGEFDILSLVKKDLNSTNMKKFYNEFAICPTGMEVKPYTKISIKKLTKKSKGGE